MAMNEQSATMRGSKALEGYMASPDTQRCAAIFRNLIGDENIDSPSSNNKPRAASLSPSARDRLLFAGVRGIKHSPTIATERFKNNSPRTVVAAATTSNDSQLLRTATAATASHYDLRDQNLSQHRSIAEILRLESQEGLRQLLPNGSLATSHLKYVVMENFVPAVCGSDESNLSTTQEHDPSVYARFLEHAADGRLAASPETGLFRIGATQGHGPAATGTEISYGLDHTDHVTLDYQPLPILDTGFTDSFDNTANITDSSQRTGSKLPRIDLIDPQTPAQPKLILERPGTIMRLSQMFAVTQPSPGSRGREALLPTSSRPSPDMFSHQQLPKDASSPLIRRGGTILPQAAAELGSSSSPLRSSPGPVVKQTYAAHQHLPELFNDYISRQESQERRRHLARAREDDDETSDDGFSDARAELNRRAKLRKEKAAMELATVGTSRPTSSANNPVEVPSTNNRQRRSLSEDYKAQCSGFDARDSQQDDIIADSQSPLVQREKQNPGNEPRQELQENCSDPNVSGHVHPQEAYTSSAKVAESESSEQLPGLDQTENSNATESERETSEPPMSRPATFPLGEVSSNIPELRTPAVQKKVLYPDGDIRVPETSPLEPHVQRYGEIVSQTPPAISAEGLEDSFNPLTQDDEFNRVLKSPTPQGKIPPINTKRARASRKLAPERNIELCDTVKVFETADSRLVEEGRESSVANETKTSSTCLRDTSEYVTAPTSLPNESLGTSNVEQKMEPHAVSPSRELADQQVVEQTAIRGRAKSMHGVRLHMENSDELSTPDGLRHEPRLTAGESGTGITTPNRFLASQVNATTASLSKSKLNASSRPAKRLAAQVNNEAVNPPVSQPSPDPSEVGLRRLRSASQLRGSARSLRRLTGNGIVMPPVTIFHDGTPPTNSRKSSRSSRQASVISTEQVMENEPQEQVTTIVSGRRKSTQTRPTEPLLFNRMAFSVSYISRDNEKKNVLRLIEQNGGRVLNLGFDELFDMSAIKLASAPRSLESGDKTGSFGLTLTPEAQTIGFACLLADEHSRKVKFMQALALGLPCISGRWIEHCVDKGMILDWDSYLLPAGESAFLGGAVRNRNLQPYSAITSKFPESFDHRPRMLTGKAILLVMSKGRVEERKKAYVFLTQALGAKAVKRVHNNAEARKFLLEAEAEGEEWNWVYVDDNEKDADKAIFGQPGAPKKRKRGFTAQEEAGDQGRAPKKVKIISDEYVIQSLILGKLLGGA